MVGKIAAMGWTTTLGSFTWLQDGLYKAIGKSRASVSYEGYLVRKAIIGVESLENLHLRFRGSWSKPEAEKTLIQDGRERLGHRELRITHKLFRF